MFHLVFVCTGNTCRSPMAEVLLKQILKQQGKVDIAVYSAGLVAGRGPASTEAQQVMAKRGLNLVEHISKPLDQELVQKADLILTMTHGHKQNIAFNFPDALRKTFTLAEWCKEGQDIADPFGGDEACYEACACQLARYLEKASEKIGQKAGNKTIS